ncbi:MAG: radical SAM protein [Magnetococcales bacterium]|nr:radical SAM protein [Magnetococcales bacterium]
MALLELHPTDACNLACSKCYYDRSSTHIGLDWLVTLLSEWRPRGIVLVGGGEPTLYRDPGGQGGFEDLVGMIRRILPECKIGLITNGTAIPPGHWQQHVTWVRISLDAATPETYLGLKGKDYFTQVRNNLIRYLQGPIRSVGVGFLCTALNVGEVNFFVQNMLELSRNQCRDQPERLNVQFRLFRTRATGRGAHPSSERELVCSPLQLDELKRAFDRLNRVLEVRTFLHQATNWDKLIAPTAESMKPSRFCFRALVFRLLRADGRAFPCFAHVDEAEYVLAEKLGQDSATYVKESEQRAVPFFFREGSGCGEQQCPLMLESHLFGSYLEGGLVDLPDRAKRSPFF